ncbi:MAG TPA: hypothetical protein VKR06_03170 [Ktedonosporobacter sp.]|nr:hypothetical protein [Ktedonosporobacter sp.]
MASGTRRKGSSTLLLFLLLLILLAVVVIAVPSLKVNLGTQSTSQEQCSDEGKQFDFIAERLPDSWVLSIKAFSGLWWRTP